jgi:hypothetical protein
MKNILITENQLRLITEALGVPDTILDAAEKVFDSVAQDIKSNRTKRDEYTFRGNVGIQLGDKKKIDSEFVKDNRMNKRFILSILSDFFDQKNAESIFFPKERKKAFE